ncbi:MAG TPA: hypothetical protein VKA46_29980 [Gemmataceae bacterium]|nr:hypothetical protein [Gemmataceae bacterium]
MSRADKALPVPSRPTLFDFFLIVTGFALSVFLSQAESLKVTPAPNAPAGGVAHLVPILPQLVRLTEGVILLWPLFFIPQRVLGRKQGITSGEWLWVIAWLGTVLLTGLAAWQTWGSVPEFLREYLPWAFVLGYLIVVPSMAAVALVLLLLGLIGRWQQPWTHTFGLVVIIWPALPVAAILAMKVS